MTLLYKPCATVGSAPWPFRETPVKQRPTTKGQPPHRLWHAIAAAEALTALGTGAEGLSDHEAAARRARYGANRLPRPRRPGLALVYLKQFASPLIYLLLAAGLATPPASTARWKSTKRLSFASGGIVNVV